MVLLYPYSIFYMMTKISLVCIAAIFLVSTYAISAFGHHHVTVEFVDYRDIVFNNKDSPDIHKISIRSSSDFKQVQTPAGWHPLSVMKRTELSNNNKVVFYEGAWVAGDDPIRMGSKNKFSVQQENKWFLPFRWTAFDNDEKIIESGSVSKTIPPVDCSTLTAEQIAPVISPWIKNNAGWWADGMISDNDFVKGIQFLIENGIIQVGFVDPTESPTENVIPSWIKNSARWWATNQISDEEFIRGLQFLIKNNIMTLSSQKSFAQMILVKDLDVRIIEASVDDSVQLLVFKALDSCQPVQGVVFTVNTMLGRSSDFYSGETNKNGEYSITFAMDSNALGAYQIEIQASKPSYKSYLRTYAIDKQTGEPLDTLSILRR
jgi:hypothetical protein